MHVHIRRVGDVAGALLPTIAFKLIDQFLCCAPTSTSVPRHAGKTIARNTGPIDRDAANPGPRNAPYIMLHGL